MRISLIAFGILAALATPALAQRNVDTIVTNGKILTVDADFRLVQALAIDDGRIVARGTSAEVARYAGPKTKVIDVKGATVIPGLIDNHFHFTRGVDTWHQQARFEGVDSRREALAILAAKAASVPAGGWVMVQGGWTPRQFADAPGGFTLAELDGVAPKNPLFVQEGYSVVYANSLALKAVGLNPADGARRSATGLVSFQPPYALYDAMPPDVTRAARAEPHGFHARAQFGRAHGRLQPGPIGFPGRSCGARGRCRFGSGRRCRSMRRTRRRRPRPRRSSSAAARISSTASSASSVSARFSTGRSSISRREKTRGPPRS